MNSDTLGRLRMLAKTETKVEAPSEEVVVVLKRPKARRSGTVSAKVGKKKKRAVVKGFDGDAALRRALGRAVLSPEGHCRFCDRRRMVIEGRLNGLGKPK